MSEVAAFLGRSRVIFDAYEFAAGDDLSAAIHRGLDRSDLFVLFASRAALASEWVRIEIDRAAVDLISGAIGKVVCFLLDDDLTVDDIPEWMKSALVVSPHNARFAALDIRRMLSEQQSKRRPRLFLGRAKAMEEASDAIADETRPLVVNGLPGVGRRTFLAELARNQLSYANSVVVELKSGDELPEVLVYLHDALGFIRPAEASALLEASQKLDPTEVASSILEAIGRACSAGIFVIFVDDGATTTDDGRLLPGFNLLFSMASRQTDADFGVAASRRLRFSDGNPLPNLRLSELDAESTQRLLRLLGNHEGVPFTREHIGGLVAYVAGYPPAAIFTVQEAKIYGPEHISQNQRSIVRFNERVFLAQLSADRKISPLMQRILGLLSAYSPLPLQVVAECLSVTDGLELDEAMAGLIDLSVVLPDGLYYRISAPIRDAAYRHFQGMSINHAAVAASLEGYLSANGEEGDSLALSQALFRASAISGGKQSDFALGVARDLISIASQSYHDQDYDRVIEFGAQAIRARPQNIDVRRVVAQAYIRRERFAEAEEHIVAMIELGALKEAFYVRGFLHRRKKEYAPAINAYKRSIEYGRGGVAVHRELAQCYFYAGDTEKAYAEIKIAEKSDPFNRYVLDLKCTIAMKRGDKDEVARCLAVLERVDTGSFAAHRRSTYELSRGDSAEALKYAKMAVEGVNWPSYEMLANLANCQIEDNDLAGAGETLGLIDRKFSNTNHDARLGLRCKLELRRGEADTAEAFWKRIHAKDLPVHRALRLGILKRRSANGGVTPEEVSEMQELEGELFSAGAKSSAVDYNLIED
ncbi:MAG: TIR domain-containing protein [Brevundimonas sp.]|nr:TIR domain-containing protein [Brevundimonas sp.]